MEPWSPYKELWITIQDVVARKNYEAINHLQSLLREHKASFMQLLTNPAKNPQHREAVKKSVNEGITLEGDPNPHTFQEDFIEESLILSDLFNLNEYSSLGLLLVGEQQLANYPSLTRGLVSVLLYWDGRRCLVNSLKTLIQCRRGHSWTLDVSDEMVGVVTEFTDDLLRNGIVETILKLLREIKVEKVLSSLSDQRGLGNAKHRRQIRDIVEEIQISLSECLFNYAAQSNLSLEHIISVIRYLESNGDCTSTGCLDSVTLFLVFTVLYGFALPCDIPLEPDDKGVDLLLDHQLLKNHSYVKDLHSKLSGPKEWKIPAIKSVMQLAWSITLHKLALVPNVISELAPIYSQTAFLNCIENDENVLELALENKVFLFMKESVMQCKLSQEEFFIRKTHEIISDLLHSMPLKIKEMRNNGDEVARIMMLQNYEMEHTTNELRKDFLQLMELITEIYKTDRNNLQLSSDYWLVANYSGSFTTPRSSQQKPKKSDLNKFVRQSGDLLPPLLYIPYINMISALSRNKINAGIVFEMLRNNSSGEGNMLSWDHFFGSLSKYYTSLRQEKQMNVYGNTMHSFSTPLYQHQTGTYTITPQEVDGLKAVLNLIICIAEYDEHACLAMYENPQWNVGTVMLGLLQCPIPTTLKSSIINALHKFAQVPEIAIGIIVLMENCQMLTTLPGSGNPGIINELEDIEAKQETYEMTQAFLKLLTVLTNTGLNMSVSNNLQSYQFDSYLNFAIDSVFLKFLSRAYKTPAEKWKIATKCLLFFDKILTEYRPDASHFTPPTQETEMLRNSMNYSAFGTPTQQTPAAISRPPGFNLLIRIMSDENMFKTIMSVIENCIKYLDSHVKNDLIEEDITNAGSFALNLILSILNAQDEFLACMRNSGSSVLVHTVDKLLLSINPVSRKADYVVTIAKFIAHNAATPRASLTSVEILFWISQSSTASQQKVVEMLTSGCSRKVKDLILHGFVEALESGEVEIDYEEETDDSDDIAVLHSKCRITIVRLLLFCVNLPSPNLAHFLLGFNMTKSTNQTSLQDPGVFGSPRTCLHAILMILSGGLDYSSPTNPFNGQQNTPVLTELSFQLIYKLAANIDTSGPLLRYLRSSHDFVFRHVGNLPISETSDSQPGNVVILQQAWLLKTASIELFLTAANRQRSHTQRLTKLLFDKCNTIKGQNDFNDTTLGTLNSTNLANFSTQVFHNTTLGSAVENSETMPEKSRILKIISAVDFCEEMPDSLKLEQFVTSQIEAAIESCEVTNEFGLVYCDIKSLHNLLQNNVNSLRGDDIARRTLAVQEIEEVLKVAVQRNQARQSMHSKLTLITAWRHVIEIAFSTCPNDLLNKEERQNIIFDILGEVLKQALNSNATLELISPLAPLFLTLITHLQAILIGPQGLLSSSYKKSVIADVTLQMQDFNMDSILNPDLNKTLTPNMIAPLQAVMKGMLEWLLQSSTNSKVRTHLYAALLYYMQLCQKPKNFKEKRNGENRRHGLRILSQNIYSKLARDNTRLFQSFGDSLKELLCKDSCDGHNVCRILAYACLDAIVKIDWEQNWLQYMLNKGYISHIAHSIVQEDHALQQSLTPQPEPLSSLYIYEQKMALLCSIALSVAGAKEVIENGVFGKLAVVQFFDLRPASDDGNMSSFLPGLMARYRQILFPALKLCTNVLATLGLGHHYEANALILEFFLAHSDALITSVLRQNIKIGDVQALTELHLVTGVLSQVASQNFNNQSIYATIPQNVVIELQGHISKIQRHLISLLPEYCLDVNTISTMKKRMENSDEKDFHKVVLLTHEIEADLLTYCRNMLNASKTDVDSGIVIFTLTMDVSSESNMRLYAHNLHSPGVGLLVRILQQSVEKFNFFSKDLSQLKRKLGDISNLPVQDLKKIVENDNEKLSMSQRRTLCALKFQAEIDSNEHILKLLHYITENSLMILWHHLDMYILKMSSDKENDSFFNSRNNDSSLNKSNLRRLNDFSNTFRKDHNIPGALDSNKPSLGVDKQALADFKQKLPAFLSDTFLDKICDVENQCSSEQKSSFIKPVIRRIQRIVKLHS